MNIQEKIKRYVQGIKSCPIFNPNDWTKKGFFKKNPIYTNSYAYALNIPIELNNSEKQIFIPGHISNSNYVTTKENLLEGLCNDLDFLGFSFRLDDGKSLEDGEYKIALYTVDDSFHHEKNDFFHFARQDQNGEWSEKTGWTGPAQKIINSGGPNPPTYENYNVVLIACLILKKCN